MGVGFDAGFAMTRNGLTQLFWGGVAVVALVCAGFLIELVDDYRSDVDWSGAEVMALDRSMPPWVTLATTSLGAFRGLAVDALWYRANRLQEEGKYYEANQLSQWITTLQPRFPQVWSFHAWNMAYNISVATYTAEERWDWVNKGIVLLRDKGIVYNPKAVRLYRELGWIFFHKIGHFMDEMQWYYKLQLAVEWQELLGAVDGSATTQQVIDRFRPIVEAPDTVDVLLKRYPGMRLLLERLLELGYSLDETLLREIGRVEMYGESARVRGVGVYRFDQEEDSYDRALAEVLEESKHEESVGFLVSFLRKRVLREGYHMDPGFMLKLMEQYGPLDWRHPAAHGCYWSEMGVKMGVSGEEGSMDRLTEIDLLNTNRQSIHALQQLAWFGRVSYDWFSHRVDLMPDPRFIPSYDRAMDAAKSRIDAGEFGDVGSSSFDMGHENFLLKAMSDHYLYGDLERSHYFYKKVRDLYGDTELNRASGRYQKPLSELVTDQLRLHMEMMANTNQFIRAILGRAFEEGLGRRRLDVFNRFVEVADLAHRKYQADKPGAVLSDQSRLRLLPFDELVEETFIAFMQSVEVPVLKRSQIWANAPLPLKQRTYDRVQTVLHEHAVLAGFIPALTFPQPTGSDREADKGIAEQVKSQQEFVVPIEGK